MTDNRRQKPLKPEDGAPDPVSAADDAGKADTPPSPSAGESPHDFVRRRMREIREGDAKKPS